jgi:hypothetical protein
MTYYQYLNPNGFRQSGGYRARNIDLFPFRDKSFFGDVQKIGVYPFWDRCPFHQSVDDKSSDFLVFHRFIMLWEFYIPPQYLLRWIIFHRSISAVRTFTERGGRSSCAIILQAPLK